MTEKTEGICDRIFELADKNKDSKFSSFELGWLLLADWKHKRV